MQIEDANVGCVDPEVLSQLAAPNQLWDTRGVLWMSCQSWCLGNLSLSQKPAQKLAAAAHQWLDNSLRAWVWACARTWAGNQTQCREPSFELWGALCPHLLSHV